MNDKRKQALLVTYAIIDHIARTNVIMDEDKELDALTKHFHKLDMQEVTTYENR